MYVGLQVFTCEKFGRGIFHVVRQIQSTSGVPRVHSPRAPGEVAHQSAASKVEVAAEQQHAPRNLCHACIPHSTSAGGQVCHAGGAGLAVLPQSCYQNQVCLLTAYNLYINSTTRCDPKTTPSKVSTIACHLEQLDSILAHEPNATRRFSHSHPVVEN